jgi:2-methylisocitrate lyase-like PEP mutase family enzyme
MGSLSREAALHLGAKSCSPFTGAKRLREMLKDPSKIVVCPGVYDGLTARIALSMGFDALYMVSKDAEITSSIDRSS